MHLKILKILQAPVGCVGVGQNRRLAEGVRLRFGEGMMTRWYCLNKVSFGDLAMGFTTGAGGC